MDLKLNKEAIFLSEVVCDTLAEQGVEFDYILPDYYPDIFKILTCRLTPGIMAYSVTGSKLTFEMAANIKIMYVAENNKKIKCIDHRSTYSKTIDLAKDCNNPVVYINPKVDYCNCRAVTSRRIDVRAAISGKVKVTGMNNAEVVSSVRGGGVQAKTGLVSYGGMKLNMNKQYTVREEIDIGQSKAAIDSILRYETTANVTDYKVIANKVVIKGEAQIKVLYTAKSEDDSQAVELIEAAVPLNQIVDIDGISDEYLCFTNLSVMYTDISVKQNSDGDNKIIGCDLTINAAVSGHKEVNVGVLSDVYSTDYESNYNMTVLKAEKMPAIVNQTLMEKISIESKDEEIDNVSDAWCTISNIICRGKNEKEMIVSGQINAGIIAQNAEGMPIYLEKQDVFEGVVEVDDLTAESSIEPLVNVVSVSYSLTSNNVVDLRVQIKFKGCLYNIAVIEAINDITVLEDKPKIKDTDYALKLYYSQANESVWDIAKKYNTSPEAIITENELDGNMTLKGGMLLIPIS